MSFSKIVEEKVIEFVSLRSELKSQVNTNFLFLDFLFEAPDVGKVELSGKEWQFQKHGRGCLFINSENIKVDIENFEVDAELFTAWELLTYFGSLGSKFANKNFKGAKLDEILPCLLEPYKCRDKQLAGYHLYFNLNDKTPT